MRKVAPPGTTVDNITPQDAVQRYREASTLLRDTLVAMLTDGALLGAQVGGKQVEYLLGVRKAEATIVGVDWDLINQDALAWVLHNPSQLGQGFGNGYANAVLAAMNTTSENQLNTLIGEWIRNGLTYNSLIGQMTQTVFSRQRAEMVAVTEIGRSFFEGSQAVWRRSGVVRRMRWNTTNDEIVARCPVCWPRHQTVTDVGGTWDGATIPGHPRCRCYATPVVDVPAATQDPDRFTISGDMAALRRANLTQDKIAQLFDIGPSAKASIVIRGTDTEVEIAGQWTDRITGELIGECTRRLFPGEKMAYLDLLSFEQKYIGNGAGMKVARDWFDALGEAGYNKAELYAGLSVGRYAWAKEGAKYIDRTQAARSTVLFREWIAEKGINLADNEYPTFTSVLDVATYTHPRGVTLTGRDISNRDVPADMALPLGKAFMLDISFNGHGGWNGVIDLAARKKQAAAKAASSAVDAKAADGQMEYINGNNDSQSDALAWAAYLVDDDTDVGALTR